MEFDIKRFALVVKKDLTENRKFYFSFLGGVLAAFVLIYAVGYSIMSNEREIYVASKSYLDNLYMRIFFFTALAFITATAVGASFAFSCVSTKAKRISYLSLPASVGEKFASRILIVFVLAPVCYLLFWLAVDVLHSVMVSMTIRDDGWYSALWTAVDMIASEITFGSLVKVVLVALAQVSVFLLGSAVFAKYSFVKTLLIEVAFFTVMGIAISILDMYLVENVYVETGNVSYRLEFPEIFFSYILPSIITAVCFLLSYRIFGRTDINGHKLFRR